MIERLKPCPFCGGNAYLHTTGKHGELTAKCDACGVEITVYHAEFGEPAQELAIATWNKRATDFQLTSLQETNRRLVEALFPESVEKNGIRVSSDAILNLEGAYEDLKRYGADAVSLRTIERVLKQLENARALLSELEQDKSDD